MTDAKTLAERLREAVNTILHYQFTHSRDGMHALQSVIDLAESGADLIEQQAAEIERLKTCLFQAQNAAIKLTHTAAKAELAAARQPVQRLSDEQIRNRLWETYWPEELLPDFVIEKLYAFARAIEKLVVERITQREVT